MPETLDPLVVELRDDPLARGYAGMTAGAVLASLETVNRARPVETLVAGQTLAAIVPAEFAALAASDRAWLQVILQVPGDIPIRAPSQVRAFLAASFGAGTATRTALVALVADRPVSRRVELALPPLSEIDIERSR